jgi:hypothetical protein
MTEFTAGRGFQLSDMGTSKGREAHVAAVVDKTRDVIFVSNNSGKPNAASRKLIRSQVMRGKNRTKPLSCPMKRGGWINQHAVSRSYQVEIPKPSLEFSGTGLSLVTFADEMQPYMLDLVFKCRRYYKHIPCRSIC